MAQNYRIYINDNTLHIADLMPETPKAIQTLDVQEFDFPTFYKQQLNKTGKSYVLLVSDASSLFKAVKKTCTLIKAAGGIVENQNGDYLFIFRNGKWDLPKGKVEKGEKMKEAAVREVEEECGVVIKSNDGKLCKTYHVYTIGEEIILKKTNWYEMRVEGNPALVPQVEEGITDAQWLAKGDLQKVLDNTFPSIRQVLEEGGLL